MPAYFAAVRLETLKCGPDLGNAVLSGTWDVMFLTFAHRISYGAEKDVKRENGPEFPGPLLNKRKNVLS